MPNPTIDKLRLPSGNTYDLVDSGARDLIAALSGSTRYLGVTNHYFWSFDTGSTAPTITWPSGITSWYGGSAPTINASKHYEVSVLNGVAVVMEV